ncbi:hypothetical protein BJV77DRAFT_1071458 [Russula vinacea]|nr:hypothetical protein BJV77DRAFT_1071458 [Russula vinacea]
MSRLSIDSISNSTTGTASDEDEHELTTVPTTPKRNTNGSALISAAPLAMGSRRKSPAPTWLSQPSDPNGYREPSSRNVEQIALASSPIHTTQMQPAPTMQLPESMTRSPPKEPLLTIRTTVIGAFQTEIVGECGSSLQGVLSLSFTLPQPYTPRINAQVTSTRCKSRSEDSTPLHPTPSHFVQHRQPLVSPNHHAGLLGTKADVLASWRQWGGPS